MNYQSVELSADNLRCKLPYSETLVKSDSSKTNHHSWAILAWDIGVDLHVQLSLWLRFSYGQYKGIDK